MRKTLRLIFFVLIFFGLLYLIWVLGNYTFSWLILLDKEVAAAAIAGFMGLSGILYAQWHAKSKEIADSHRRAKIEVYETFFDIVERFMAAEKGEEESLDPENDNFPEELKDQFTKLSRGMIIWASPRVINSWSAFRERSSTAKTPADTLLAVDDVLQAIRADLGNSNFGLTRGAVIKLYLSNPSEMDV